MRLPIAVIIIVATSVLGVMGYKWISWDPIGEVSDNGWRNFWGPCEKREILSIPNGKGEIATLRLSECPIVYVDVDRSYFVFLHKRQELNKKWNLVFRYKVNINEKNSQPKIMWITNSSLKITVGSDNILQVTKQLRHIEGIDIVYDLGRAEFPPALEFWQRPLF